MANKIKVGPRLPYVVVPLEGTITRETFVLESRTIGKGKNEKTIVDRKARFSEQPAGYMVYFPGGHAIRINEKELKRRGFDRTPRPINADGLTHALITQEASAIMDQLSKEVISGITHKVGTELLTRDASRTQEAA